MFIDRMKQSLLFTARNSSCGKVIFFTSVYHSFCHGGGGGGEGMCGREAYMWPGHAWQGHVWQRLCVAGGHTW